MQVEVWSDVVCPFCYIGVRRLSNAVAAFEHGDEVELVVRSFELDPNAPTEPTETVADMLARKYGMSPAERHQAMAGVQAMAAGEGLTLDQDDAPHANTHDAHRLLHLALAEGGPGVQSKLNARLMSEYFVSAQNLADHGLLRQAAVAAGLDPERVNQVLAGEEYEAEVAADIQQARTYGATGVPFVVIDGKYGISGAQPTEVFSQALN